MNLLSIIENKRYTFIIFFLLTTFLYSYAAEAGFYEDFIGFMKLQKESTFLDFVLSPKKSLYQGVNLFHFIFIELFGANYWLWFLLFSALHAACATIILKFLGNWFKFMGWYNYGATVVFASLFFLLSPIVTEVVIWKACSHYITTTIIIFAILNWLIKYLTTGDTRHVWFIAIAFYISTFLLEYFYLIPIFIFLLTAAAFFAKRIDITSVKRVAIRVFIPICLLFLIYFVTLYFKLHTSLARVGGDTGLQITPGYVFDRFSKYTIRVYLMDYFFPNNVRSWIESTTATKTSVIITAIVLSGVAVLGAFKYQKLSPKWQVSYTLFVLAYSSCVVILPMWYYNSFSLIGSRYYYLGSIFFYTLICVVVFSSIKSHVISNGLIIFYLLINIIGTAHIVDNAGKAGKISNALMDNFKWKNADTVLLLNLQENFKGVGMIQSSNPSTFSEHLLVLRNDTIRGKIYDVASYNLVSKTDGAHLTVQDSTTLKVTLNQYGTWWWFSGLGASDYENDAYKFTLVEEGFSYILKLKQKPGSGTVILYQVGSEWKVVDMNKIGIEQW